MDGWIDLAQLGGSLLVTKILVSLDRVSGQLHGRSDAFTEADQPTQCTGERWWWWWRIVRVMLLALVRVIWPALVRVIF